MKRKRKQIKWLKLKMTKFFNALLLNLILLSGRYQFDAVLLDSPTLDKDNFEIEDSEFNEIENLPTPFRSYSRHPDNRNTQAYAKRKRNDRTEATVGLFPWNPNNVQLEANVDSLRGVDYCCNAGNLPKEFTEYGPLDVSSISAKLKKWNLMENPRIKRDSERFLGAPPTAAPIRYLDYTNSQMPFNEGRLRGKGFKTTKNPEVADKSLYYEKNDFDFEGYPERKSVRRRRFYEAPRRFRFLEIGRDDPLSEYSRVRRFLDHKRAKKQIRMTSTLEAKEAAMSRILDPNLNLDGILEPHVRKRRGLHTKKRDLSFTARQPNRVRLKQHRNSRRHHDHHQAYPL